MSDGAEPNDPATIDPQMSDPRVEWLSVAGDADTWRSLGLTVTDEGTIPLVGASIRIVPERPEGDTGIVGWALSSGAAGAATRLDIDGLATDVVAAQTPLYADHPLGASGLDHVVVMTADLERTSGAIAAATGCELKRIRELGTMRQGFHRIGRGGLIVELVERPDLPDGLGEFLGCRADRRRPRRSVRPHRTRPRLVAEGRGAARSSDRHGSCRRRPGSTRGVDDALTPRRGLWLARGNGHAALLIHLRTWRFVQLVSRRWSMHDVGQHADHTEWRMVGRGRVPDSARDAVCSGFRPNFRDLSGNRDEILTVFLDHEEWREATVAPSGHRRADRRRT